MASPFDDSADGSVSFPDAETPAGSTTVDLLAKARAGDATALDEVFRRAGPALRRWARGRLPGWARDLLDTDDLVQETMMRTLKHLDVFESMLDSLLGWAEKISKEHSSPADKPADTESQL